MVMSRLCQGLPRSLPVNSKPKILNHKILHTKCRCASIFIFFKWIHSCMFFSSAVFIFSNSTSHPQEYMVSLCCSFYTSRHNKWLCFFWILFTLLNKKICTYFSIHEKEQNTTLVLWMEVYFSACIRHRSSFCTECSFPVAIPKLPADLQEFVILYSTYPCKASPSSQKYLHILCTILWQFTWV